MPRTRLIVIATLLLVLLLGTIALDNLILGANLIPELNLPDSAQTFVTIFLGVFIEAAAFLLIGSLASGFVAVYVSNDDIARMIPRNPILATCVGALIGMIFPVCECGVVPLVRRLYQKGLPISAGFAFLLGAPVLNPVVIASTYAAYGNSTILWARLGFTFIIAVGVGLIFLSQPDPRKILLRPDLFPHLISPSTISVSETATFKSEHAVHDQAHDHGHDHGTNSGLQRALTIAADEFFDMGRYMIFGTLLSTSLQLFVPQSTLLSIGTNPVLSVVAMQALAFVLSVCSTVDAFLSLNFINTFTTGSVIAFLVFGPMIDIKSTMMFLGVYQRRVVIYLAALLTLSGLVVGLLMT
ncbi:MAG: permease [Anaerolineae bacterium]|nr:permease [Anaerolineae bacterium]